MGAIVYLLCAGTALLCTFLLLRAYLRKRARLLFWSGLCFAGLSINNLVLVLDRIVFPEIDLSLWRLLVALIAMLPLLYGLIWDEE
ncbi:hypothetical protein SAMN06265795_103138 [Noviherbaspirillum humi]|uniref:Uncharacterized protein n=1 Tax=Noviherbaspirillum humi TaxID=1688639 RepID=A0A239F3Y4_9BURK|nr:DUF5985 family protein [Noviherbaspirillum humi]SNS50973.1 hypothetical protein SAMN06265795_103138 [Noviherbaspirillum humi]